MVYLLHFEKKYHHAQHYIGYTQDVETFMKRMQHHNNGSGSRLMRTIVNNGINYVVARVWIDKDGNFERRLKNKKNTRFYCPICQNKNLRKIK